MQNTRKYDKDGKEMFEDQPGRIETSCDDCGNKLDWFVLHFSNGKLFELCIPCRIARKYLKLKESEAAS